MIDNPLEQPVPESRIEQIEAFARDLAYGFNKGLWGGVFTRMSEPDEPLILWTEVGSENEISTYLREKWDNYRPEIEIMVHSGYLSQEEQPSRYTLTPKALELLKKPAAAPQVFVSYRRSSSSAFAALVVARLKLADRMISVFTDKDIPLGEQWADLLEERVRSTKYFVCLLAPDTLESEWVRKEINWAFESDSIVISITHNGFRLDNEDDESQEIKEIREKLKTVQVHRVLEENIDNYDDAMNRLVRNLGYSTL